MEFRNPKLTVDIVVLDTKKGLLLVKRRNEPEKGKWALPGGFVDYDEDPREAAKREAKEETGIDIDLIEERKAWVYGEPGRDPRGHIVTLVFMAKQTDEQRESPDEPQAGDDAEDARYFSEEEYAEAKIAFDHIRIIREVLGWKNNQSFK